MAVNNQDMDALAAFGLTSEQTCYLFSLERLLAINDVTGTKNEKQAQTKNDWINHWTDSVGKILSQAGHINNQLILNRSSLVESMKNAVKDSNNLTWYYLVILEAVTFEAYTPLGIKESDKAFVKLKYMNQIEFIKAFVSDIGVGTPETVERYFKMYNRALNKGQGKVQKIAIKLLTVVAVSAIIAATAGVLAGPIAVAMFGTEFAGLYGAALVNACLAFAGGGAIAAGGAGVAGGVFTIVGGGALLGAAGSSAAVAGFSLMAKSTPEFALSQAAKLDVVLREIILNGQKDVKKAQSVLENFKEQIANMQKEIEMLKLEQEKDKTIVKNLKKSVGYMERLFVDANKFTSAFEIGLSAASV